MIHLENLRKEFRIYKKKEGFMGAVKGLFSSEYSVKKAVDGVSFTIDQGESVGYIGVNGAGKSTTIKMMTGILMPTSGTCQVLGVDPFKERRTNAKNIGVVFGQRSQLWWDLPVSESFSLLQKIYDIPKARFAENLAFFKETLDLEEFYLTPVRSLSLGQKMRADFAAAMLHDPKVLFLDEPTIGLDIVVKDRIRALIRRVNEERKTTVILTTHDLADIEEVCKRIIVIDAGTILFDGSIEALKSNFGTDRVVHFDLASPGTKPLDGAIPSCVTADEKDHLLSLSFPPDQVNVGDLIAQVMHIREVRDIRITETQMEDVVKKIYAQAKVTGSND